MDTTTGITISDRRSEQRPFSAELKLVLRVITLVMLLTMLVVWSIGLQPMYWAMSTACEPDCGSAQITNEDIAAFEAMNISAEFYAALTVFVEFVVVLTYTLCCLLLLWKLSDNWAGWVASLIFAGSVLIGNGAGYGFEQLGPGAFIEIIEAFFGTLFGTSLILFAYVFPSGRFFPRRLFWPLVIFLLLNQITGAGDAFYEERPLWAELFTIIWVGFFMLGVISQFVRYRQTASETERLQMRWVGFGILMMGIGLVMYLSMIEWWAKAPGAPRGLIQLVFVPLIMLAVLPLPITVTTAILRYKLWNIDLIINRTLVYSILTALIVGIYVGVVGGMGTLFNASGEQALALVATGIVAITFHGLRDRAQQGINRMMFGQRDDPQAVLSQLTQRLQSAMLPEELLSATVTIVADTLKLPYAAISFRRGEEAILQAEHGESRTPTESIPLVYHNEDVGQLIVGNRSPGEALSPADRTVLENIARQMGAVVYAVRLQIELRQARERLVIAREEERRRLRRDLHDGLGPALASQNLKLDTAIDLFDTHSEEVRKLLFEVRAQSDELIADIRRLVHDLRPPALDELGLVRAIENAMIRLNSIKNGTAIKFTAPDDLQPIPAAVEAAAYRIVMEAVTNVVKHARAQHCLVRLEIREVEKILLVRIDDDGVGIATPIVSGIGLQSMRERAEELGGGFLLAEGAGGGTCVMAQLPLSMKGGIS